MSKVSIREELRSKWQAAAEVGSAGSEWRAIALSIAAPVKLLAGIREPDARIALLLETPLSTAPRTVLRTQSEAVSLTDQRRQEEGLMRLAITLERDDSTDVFEVLVADLAEVASNTTSPQSAIATIVRQLEAWQACLRSHRRGLSREEQIGLLGELAILRLVAEELGLSHAVASWKGPLDAIHDFSHAGTALEVKAVLGAGNHLRISKLNQLETEGLNRLLVVRPRFRELPDGPTITDLIASLRTVITQQAAEVLSDFDELLIRAGVRDTSPHGDQLLRAELESILAYDVREEFPRLTFESVPIGIVDGTYVVDERAVASFCIDQTELRKIVRGTEKGA